MKEIYMKKNIKFYILCVTLCISFFLYGIYSVTHNNFLYRLSSNIYSNFKEPRDLRDLEEKKFWINELKKGGYIIHFRHTQREKWFDVTAFDAYALKNNIDEENTSFSSAVCLTKQGIEEAILIGKIFNEYGIKINKVISSPSCRAKQTAKYAFGGYDIISNSLLHRTAMLKDQHKDFGLKLKNIILDNSKLLGETNLILSGHAGTLSYDAPILFTKNKIENIDEREEGGFAILRVNSNEEIEALYKFNSIKEFASSIIEIPIN